MKHRTPEEIKELEKRVISSIHAETQAKSLAADTGATLSYAYGIAKRLGFSSMLVSTQEREVLREMRGVAHRFKKRKAA